MSSYAKRAWPLIELLKKDRFRWNDEAEAAFQTLKSAMIKVPVLAQTDFSKQFVVETDGSNHRLGAILMQDSHPITFFSKVLPQECHTKVSL